ncbi:TPA: amidophosphoribosyltransferase [Candidatus Acetothermia bacterium]|nr:amidophosphoribosyltransferase [Candidatus Acetothermia bacterium]
MWRVFSKTVKRIDSVGTGLVSLFFPPRCYLCREELERLDVICDNCRNSLPRISGPMCTVCGQPLVDELIDLCHSCGIRLRHFDMVRTLGIYRDGWQRLIQGLKFEGEKAIAGELSALMADYLKDKDPFGVVDTFSYVPLNRRRRRQRGFNQSQLLANSLSRTFSIPVEHGLRKIRATPPQTGLSRQLRRKSLHNAFTCRPSTAKGRTVLIDDVYTTGTTVEECAQALKRAGYERVFVLTVARTL